MTIRDRKKQVLFGKTSGMGGLGVCAHTRRARAALVLFQPPVHYCAAQCFRFFGIPRQSIDPNSISPNAMLELSYFRGKFGGALI